jgi:hypothetical protein
MVLPKRKSACRFMPERGAQAYTIPLDQAKRRPNLETE